MDGAPVGRRVFLGLLGVGAAGSCSAPTSRTGSSGRSARHLAKDGTGLSASPAHRPVPHLLRHRQRSRRAPHDEYRLSVSGLVDQPITLTFADLPCDAAHRADPRLPVRHGVAGVRRCSGRASGSATCSTAPACRPKAKALRFTSFDGTYTESLTLTQARRHDVIVAYELEGRPSPTTTADRCGSTSRRCTATSASSGSTGIEVTDEVVPGLLGASRLRHRRDGSGDVATDAAIDEPTLESA